MGRKCDECAADHWKLDSREGCMPCKCDTTGTFADSTHCDQNTGQCSCVEGRGGKRCDECPFNYWGSPRTECKSNSFFFLNHKCLGTIEFNSLIF